MAAPDIPGLQPLDFTIPTSRIILLAVACGLFVVAGLYVRFTASVPLKIVGLVSIGFFGRFGLMAVRQFARNRITLRLEDGGIRPVSGGLIPWPDVEQVDVAYLSSGGYRTKIIGIRLRNYDNYIRSLTPAQIQLARTFAKWGRGAGIATIPAKIDLASVLEAVTTGEFKDLLNYDVITAPQQNLAAQLLWSRRMSGGWDISFSPLLFSRPAAQTVDSIEHYRRAAMDRGDGTGGPVPRT